MRRGVHPGHQGPHSQQTIQIYMTMWKCNRKHNCPGANPRHSTRHNVRFCDHFFRSPYSISLPCFQEALKFFNICASNSLRLPSAPATTEVSGAKIKKKTKGEKFKTKNLASLIKFLSAVWQKAGLALQSPVGCAGCSGETDTLQPWHRVDPTCGHRVWTTLCPH